MLEMIRENAPTTSAIVFMLSSFPETRDGAIDRVVNSGAVAWLEKTKTTPMTLATRLDQALRMQGPNP